MKKSNVFVFAAVFAALFAGQSFASEKDRADLQTQVDATNLNEYNAQKMNDTLTDIADSAFLKLADTIDYFRICGDATTVNNNTVYYGPSRTLTANTFDGTACDINAVGNTTEATADISFFNKALYVSGMTCRNEADADANITYTLRGGAADLTPSVTCTIADGERDCVADVQATNLRGPNGAWAVAVSSTSDVADNNGFVCNVKIRY